MVPLDEASGVSCRALSARQLIPHRISEIVSMYVHIYILCMYVSVTLRNAIISRATRKRTCTCAAKSRAPTRIRPSPTAGIPACELPSP